MNLVNLSTRKGDRLNERDSFFVREKFVFQFDALRVEFEVHEMGGRSASVLSSSRYKGKARKRYFIFPTVAGKFVFVARKRGRRDAIFYSYSVARETGLPDELGSSLDRIRLSGRAGCEISAPCFPLVVQEELSVRKFL